MATASPYMDATYPAAGRQYAPSTTPQSGARLSKRKRDLHDNSAAGTPSASSRGMPHPRRSSSQHHANEDQNNAFNEQTMQNPNTGAQFDLSALHAQSQPQNAPHSAPSQPSMGSTAAAALRYTMNVPPQPGHDFLHEPTVGADGHPVSDFHQAIDSLASGPGPGGDASTPPRSAGHDPNASATDPLSDSAQTPGLPNPSGLNKPAVGTDQWNKQRKDNHKEVERRRRETINEGINELAKIVPGCEKNKGSILARAVQYIQKLQDDASSNIDKWTFEKLVTEQAIGDLSGKLDRVHAMVAALKREAVLAGVNVEEVETGIGIETEATAQQHLHQQQSSNGGNGAVAAAALAGAQRAQAQHRPMQHQQRIGTANMGQSGEDGAGDGTDGKTAQ